MARASDVEPFTLLVDARMFVQPAGVVMVPEDAFRDTTMIVASPAARPEGSVTVVLVTLPVDSTEVPAVRVIATAGLLR
jgi:hypothetical protein